MQVNLKKMSTEKRNPKTMNLDKMSSLQIIKAMNEEDVLVPLAIKKELKNISKVVDYCVESILKGGRVFYIGAGTSGRLGVLDASECPPTFGVDSNLFIGLIAGGEAAFLKAIEGAEDSLTLAKEDLRKHKLNKKDIVIGIAASGRTPYVIGGLEYAKSKGCHTASISCNLESKIGEIAETKIEVVCGPEVLTGSTRLKAGTAQKLILNMISTASMVRCGKSYQNLMVDVVQTNEKLHARAVNILMTATGVNNEEAEKLLITTKGRVKPAIVMALTNCDYKTAINKLNKSFGHVREAIK